MSAARDQSPVPVAPPRQGEVVLGLDVGDVRIGVARGVVGSAMAFGRGAVAGHDHEEVVRAVAAAMEREGARRLVIGLPLRTDGSEGTQSRRVRALADRLAALGVPIELIDERFTTQAAQRAMRGSGLPRRKRQQKERIDEASAVLILETWLARYGGAVKEPGAGTEAGPGGGEA